jgi:hypothetical protein
MAFAVFERHTTRNVRPVLWLFLPFALVGCETRVSAIHQPLYEDFAHESSIEATARNTASGIRKITITVTTGEMVDCADVGWEPPPTVIPCRRNASTVSHVCTYSGSPSNATCTYTQPLGRRRIVTYSAEVEPVMGSSQRTPFITYAGGPASPKHLARPVLWNVSRPATERIDIGFFPDADYLGNYHTFSSDTDILAYRVFFEPGKVYNQDYAFFRGTVNLWAAPLGADAVGIVEGLCTMTFGGLAAPVAAEMDGEAIFHRETFQDCAKLAYRGAGTVDFSNTLLNDPGPTFVHESGHFLHGLGDEYRRSVALPACRNVFPSQAECQADAPGHNADPADCVQIGSTGTWRNDNGNPEIMATSDENNDWQDDSLVCMTRRFLSCSQGVC